MCHDERVIIFLETSDYMRMNESHFRHVLKYYVIASVTAYIAMEINYKVLSSFHQNQI